MSNKIIIHYRGYGNLNNDDEEFDRDSMEEKLYMSFTAEITNEAATIDDLRSSVSHYLNELYQNNPDSVCKNCFTSNIEDGRCQTCNLYKKYDPMIIPPFKPSLLFTQVDKAYNIININQTLYGEFNELNLYFLFNYILAGKDDVFKLSNIDKLFNVQQYINTDYLIKLNEIVEDSDEFEEDDPPEFVETVLQTMAPPSDNVEIRSGIVEDESEEEVEEVEEKKEDAPDEEKKEGVEEKKEVVKQKPKKKKVKPDKFIDVDKDIEEQTSYHFEYIVQHRFKDEALFKVDTLKLFHLLKVENNIKAIRYLFKKDQTTSEKFFAIRKQKERELKLNQTTSKLSIQYEINEDARVEINFTTTNKINLYFYINVDTFNEYQTVLNDIMKRINEEITPLIKSCIPHMKRVEGNIELSGQATMNNNVFYVTSRMPLLQKMFHLDVGIDESGIKETFRQMLNTFGEEYDQLPVHETHRFYYHSKLNKLIRGNLITSSNFDEVITNLSKDGKYEDDVQILKDNKPAITAFGYGDVFNYIFEPSRNVLKLEVRYVYNPNKKRDFIDNLNKIYIDYIGRMTDKEANIQEKTYFNTFCFPQNQKGVNNGYKATIPIMFNQQNKKQERVFAEIFTNPDYLPPPYKHNINHDVYICRNELHKYMENPDDTTTLLYKIINLPPLAKGQTSLTDEDEAKRKEINMMAADLGLLKQSKEEIEKVNQHTFFKMRVKGFIESTLNTSADKLKLEKIVNLEMFKHSIYKCGSYYLAERLKDKYSYSSTIQKNFNRFPKPLDIHKNIFKQYCEENLKLGGDIWNQELNIPTPQGLDKYFGQDYVIFSKHAVLTSGLKEAVRLQKQGRKIIQDKCPDTSKQRYYIMAPYMLTSFNEYKDLIFAYYAYSLIVHYKYHDKKLDDESRNFIDNNKCFAHSKYVRQKKLTAQDEQFYNNFVLKSRNDKLMKTVSKDVKLNKFITECVGDNEKHQQIIKSKGMKAYIKADSLLFRVHHKILKMYDEIVNKQMFKGYMNFNIDNANHVEKLTTFINNFKEHTTELPDRITDNTDKNEKDLQVATAIMDGNNVISTKRSNEKLIYSVDSILSRRIPNSSAVKGLFWYHLWNMDNGLENILFNHQFLYITKLTLDPTKSSKDYVDNFENKIRFIYTPAYGKPVNIKDELSLLKITTDIKHTSKQQLADKNYVTKSSVLSKPYGYLKFNTEKQAHELLFNMFETTDNHETSPYVMRRVEKTNAELVDAVLYQLNYDKTDYDSTDITNNRQIFVKKLETNLTDIIFNTLNNGQLKRKYKTRQNLFDTLNNTQISVTIDEDDVIPDDDMVELLSRFAGETKLDIFQFYTTEPTLVNDEKLDIHLHEYYHPDQYHTSHTPIYIFKASNKLFNIIENGAVSEDEKDKNQTTLYNWLETAKKYPRTLREFINSYNVNHYDITMRQLRRYFKGYTKTEYLNDSLQTIYVRFANEENKYQFPTVPYIYTRKNMNNTAKLSEYNVLSYTETMKDLNYLSTHFKGYTPHKHIIINKNIVGIMSHNKLITPCQATSIDDNVEKLEKNKTLYALYDEINSEFYKNVEPVLSKFDKMRTRDYLYNKLRYHLMNKNISVAESKNREYLMNVTQEYFKDIDHTYDVIYDNNYSSELEIPKKYHEYMVSRLIYEHQTLKLKQFDVVDSSKRIEEISDLYLFKKQENEEFFVYKVVKPKQGSEYISYV